MMENACLLKEKRPAVEINQYKVVALRQSDEIHALKKTVREPELLYSLPIETICETVHERRVNQNGMEMQNEELKRARAEKDESLRRMAGAVAHHFNNQLTVVMCSLELFLNDLPENAKNTKNLRRSMEAAQKAAAMSRQMLRYLGQPPGRHEPLSLSECCSRSLARLQHEMPEKIVLNCHFPDSGPVIHADKDHIHHVLAGLVTNGGESFSGNPGTLTLTITTVSPKDMPVSKCLPLDWQPEAVSYACLEVTDTGCGIADRDMQKIFDPFFTTKFTGRGMGLPVALEFVKNHGGCISVASKPGQGSVFRVYLPVPAKNLSSEEKPLDFSA